jgi:hypothetical protein
MVLFSFGSILSLAAYIELADQKSDTAEELGYMHKTLKTPGSEQSCLPGYNRHAIHCESSVTGALFVADLRRTARQLGILLPNSTAKT